MDTHEILDMLIAPEHYFPSHLRLGRLLGNKEYLQAASRFVDSLKETQFWPLEQLEYIQTQRLKRLVEWVGQRSAFWAGYFERHGVQINAFTSLGCLKLLPRFDRTMLQHFGDSIYVINEDQQGLTTRNTSGTSGIRIKLMHDDVSRAVSSLYRYRHPAFDNVSLGSLLQRQYSVRLGGHWTGTSEFAHYAFTGVAPLDLENQQLRREIYEKIREAAPSMLDGYPSLILKLTQHAIEDRPDLPLFAVHIHGEPIDLEDRKFIKDQLGVPLMNVFATTESHPMGFECPENMGKFHLYAERVILEVVDRYGKPVEIGQEGDFLVTVLDHRATPLIRYALDNEGRIVPEKCPCGRTLPLFEFSGRRGAELKLPSGRTVRMLYVHQKLTQGKPQLRSKVIQFQVKQESLERVRLTIVPKRTFSEEEEAAIREAFKDIAGGEVVAIDIEYVEKIPVGPGGKAQLFVPLRDDKKLISAGRAPAADTLL